MPVGSIFFLSPDWFDKPSTFRCGWTFDIRLDKQSRLEVETKNFSITCNITMETYSNSQLMVFFDTLNISGYCPQNRVELHDGKSTRFPLIGGNIKELMFDCFCLFIIVYIYICVSVCHCTYVFMSLYICLFVCLSLYVCLIVCLSLYICLFVCLSLYICLFVC